LALQFGGDGKKLLPMSSDRIKPPLVVQSALVCRAGPAKLRHHLIRSSAESGGGDKPRVVETIVWTV
jgi:hypothetical protein